MNDSTVTDLLQKLSDDKAILHIPVFILMGLLMFKGFIGNAFVCYFYGPKSNSNPTSCFIVGLAILDLLSCTISMPMEIVDIRFFYMFPNATVCKILRTTAVIFTMSSAFILVAIATERYRRICLPFRKQITVLQAKLICIISTIIACAISWPGVIFFSLVPVDVPINSSYIIQGYDCTTVKGESVRIYLLSFCALHILLFMFASVAIIVLYFFVYRQLIRGKHFRQRCQNQLESSSEHQDLPQAQGKDTASSSVTSLTCIHNDVAEKKPNNLKDITNAETSINTTKITLGFNINCINLVQNKRLHNHGHDIDVEYRKQYDIGSKQEHDINSIDLSDSGEAADENASKKVVQGVIGYRFMSPSTQKKSRDVTTDKFTTIMFVITVVFIVSYLPYLGLAVWQSFSLNYIVNQITDWQLVLFSIGIHSYFLNSVSNPFIYGFFNSQFRKFIVSVFACAFRCQKGKKTLRPL